RTCAATSDGLSVCFTWSGDHRDLLSFPTRRSSDLEVLLVRRGRAPRQGEWSLPGGSIEPGETARQAAAREALEETGLRVIVRDVVDVFDAIIPEAEGRPGYHYCVPDFLAEPEVPAAEPRAGDDALDARW